MSLFLSLFHADVTKIKESNILYETVETAIILRTISGGLRKCFTIFLYVSVMRKVCMVGFPHGVTRPTVRKTPTKRQCYTSKRGGRAFTKIGNEIYCRLFASRKAGRRQGRPAKCFLSFFKSRIFRVSGWIMK